MTMRDEDFGATPTLAEGEDGLWSPSMAASGDARCARRPAGPMSRSGSRAGARRGDAGRAKAGAKYTAASFVASP